MIMAIYILLVLTGKPAVYAEYPSDRTELDCALAADDTQTYIRSQPNAAENFGVDSPKDVQVWCVKDRPAAPAIEVPNLR